MAVTSRTTHDRSCHVAVSRSSIWEDGLPEPFEPNSLSHLDSGQPQLAVGLTYVPGVTRGGEEAAAEVHALDDGRTALLAYSSLSRLVDCLGQAQPWIALTPSMSAEQLQLVTGADLVIWDAMLPESLRREDETSRLTGSRSIFKSFTRCHPACTAVATSSTNGATRFPGVLPTPGRPAMPSVTPSSRS
ncbi:SAV_915 family protein [Amycolatopsis keratiniphila]|uniref:SAV_915 family protein n=1 Tax=Amycolatopsis keratiniphila TaxID=129921 RepID=UPI00340B9822